MSSHDDDEEYSLNTRRKFLKVTGGTAGIGLLVGCSGDNGDGDGGGDGGDEGDSDGGGDGGDGGDGDGEGDGDTDYPEEDIELIVPYSPGGGYDTYARLIAPYLSEELGVDVIVRNVEGGGGTIATEQVFNAEPDGYTIMISNAGTFAEMQVAEDVGYDQREFSWIGQILAESRVICVAEQTGIETWDEYVSAVQNEELNFFSTGRFASGTTAAMLPGELSGLYPAENVLNNLVIDPEGGTTSSALTMMERDEVHVLATAWGSALVGIDAGISRPILANTTAEEFEPRPDLATLETEDVPNREQIAPMCTAYRGFCAPPDMPEDRLEILREAFAAAADNDEFLADAEDADRRVGYGGPEEIRDAITTIIETWEENQDLLDRLLED